MSAEEKDEMGRFYPKGDPNKPREPFLPHESPKINKPSIESLHIPNPPLDKQKLKTFLIELQPIVEHSQTLSRDDRHLAAKALQEVKEGLHEGSFSEEIVREFEKITVCYHNLLVHSTPEDKEEVVESIKVVLNKLNTNEG